MTTHKLLALEQVAVVHVRRMVSGHKAEDFGRRGKDSTEGDSLQGAGVLHKLWKG